MISERANHPGPGLHNCVTLDLRPAFTKLCSYADPALDEIFVNLKKHGQKDAKAGQRGDLPFPGKREVTSLNFL